MIFRTFAAPVALAVSMCACTAAHAEQDVASTPAATEQAASPLTPQGAADFVAAAEQDLTDYSLEASQANWVNETYITEDTDAIAARVNAAGTEMQVRFANEAAKYAEIPGLDHDVKRKLDMLRRRSSCRRRRRPARPTELNRDRDQAAVGAYGKGQGTLDGKPINGSRHRGGDGQARIPRRAARRCGRAGTTMSARR